MERLCARAFARNILPETSISRIRNLSIEERFPVYRIAVVLYWLSFRVVISVGKDILIDKFW